MSSYIKSGTGRRCFTSNLHISMEKFYWLLQFADWILLSLYLSGKGADTIYNLQYREQAKPESYKCPREKP